MRILVLIALVLTSNTALAQSIFQKLDRFYVGTTLTAIDGNMKNTDGVSAHFFTLEFNGGYKHSSWLGAEARVGLGITKETIPNPDYDPVPPPGTPAQPATVDVKVDHHASIYWRPETANPTAKLYGLLGATTMSVNSNSRSGLSYGGGIGFKMYDHWNFNVEYRMLFSDENDDFNAFSAGVDYRF